MKILICSVVLSLSFSPHAYCQISAVEAGSPEAAKKIAEHQNRLSRDAQEWQTVKKITLLEKIPEKPRGQTECLSPGELQENSIGYLEYWNTEVIQITGANDALLMLANPRHPPVWLSGFPTKGLVDGQKVRIVGPVKVSGTKTYTTAAGAQKTVNVIKLLSQEEVEQSVAEAKEAADKLLYRAWKDAGGKQMFSAKFIEFKNNKVRLQQKDVEEITELAIGQLSKSDQQWIRDELKQRSAVKKK